MKAFKFLLLAAAAVTFVAVSPADAREKTKKQVSGDSYQVVTYEGNKKITTTYKAIGSRKVGLVGKNPYPVSRDRTLQQGGEYYTQDGVKYFHPSKKLDVEYTGRLNK